MPSIVIVEIYDTRDTFSKVYDLVKIWLGSLWADIRNHNSVMETYVGKILNHWMECVSMVDIFSQGADWLYLFLGKYHTNQSSYLWWDFDRHSHYRSMRTPSNKI